MNDEEVKIVFADDVAQEHADCVNKYIDMLRAKNLPPILSLEHFSMLCGLKASYIYKATNGTAHFYRRFVIPKASGGQRKIDAPLPALLLIQQWILSNILNFLEIDKSAKAYKKGLSTKDNARLHRKQSSVFKTDVLDFFGSIKEFHVFRIFEELGYTKDVATFLSKLCCLDGRLPQGAATSGYLSNIYMKSFDSNVLAYCRHINLRYSRYADDITISGTIEHPDKLKSFIENELKNIELKMNYKKTSIKNPHHQQRVTGIVVNESMSVGKQYLRQIRMDCYYIQKFGLLGHARSVNSASPLICLDNLIGRLTYARHINGKSNFIVRNIKFLTSLRREFF